MSTKIRFEKDQDNAPAKHADVDHGAVGAEKEDNLNLGLVQQGSDVAEEMKLDDARRVKAVSPGLLVVKRFFRNKLAMVGLTILVVLFLFCFLGAAIYPYSQSETFTTIKEIEVDYAFAKINTTYNNMNVVPDYRMPKSTVRNSVNIYIKDLDKQIANGGTNQLISTDDTRYVMTKLADKVYKLEYNGWTQVADLQTSKSVGTFSADKVGCEISLTETNNELKQLLLDDWAAKAKKVENVSVVYNGATYTMDKTNKVIVCTLAALTEDAEARLPEFGDEIVNEAYNHLDDRYTVGTQTFYVRAYNSKGNVGYHVELLEDYPVLYATTLNFDRYNLAEELSLEFKEETFNALGTMAAAAATTTTYTVGGKEYTVTAVDDHYEITYQEGGEAVQYVYMSSYSIRRYTGEDTISVRTKLAFRAVMDSMIAAEKKEYETTIEMEALDEGNYIYDEGGNLQFADEEFYVKTEDKGFGQQFVFRNNQEKMVADINAPPSKEHILGLDGNAMDVLARIMYGGRISLLIGFIVVFIEIILGSIMGGISGYFGGAVDNIIMRIVDIFYCIPTMPILIILGAMFNTLKVDNMLRVVYMMMILGFLGWPGIARLVRGQILSLREQDFMIAAEASGLTAKRKIAKHLIPNVIPQLIVQATMGLGGVILLESTLSFLGLGVKFPIATWGQIINSVKDIDAMQTYTYIWIPVGALICLAVIAFNFVGDGLRDAFDPKMSR